MPTVGRDTRPGRRPRGTWPSQPSGSSGRGARTCRAATRFAGDRPPPERHRGGAAGGPRDEPLGDEPGVERVTSAGRVDGRDRTGRDIEARVGASGRQHRRAGCTPLHDDDRGQPEGAVGRPSAGSDQGVELARRREQEIRGHLADERDGDLPATRQERADRGEVEAHQGPGGAGMTDRRPAGQAQGLAQERVGGQVEKIDPGEPASPEIVRAELVGGAAVGHERALAAGPDEDTDPAGGPTGNATDPGHHPVGADRVDERPPGGIAADRADQRRTDPEPAEPAGRVRGRPTLAEPDPTRDVRPPLQGS